MMMRATVIKEELILTMDKESTDKLEEFKNSQLMEDTQVLMLYINILLSKFLTICHLTKLVQFFAQDSQCTILLDTGEQHKERK